MRDRGVTAARQRDPAAELARIADALERLADAAETRRKPRSRAAVERNQAELVKRAIGTVTALDRAAARKALSARLGRR